MADRKARNEWYKLNRSPSWILELSDDEVEKLSKYVKSEEMASFNQRLIEEVLE